MASKTQKAQHLTLALSDGLMDMLWNQTYKNRSNNKTFSAIRIDIKDKCNEIREYIKSQNGVITQKDVDEMQKIIDIFKKEYLIDAKNFTPMMAVAIMVDMVIYQIKYTKGKKNELFMQLLIKINYLVRYFDKKRKWEDKEDNCLKAAERLRQLIGV